MAHKLNPGVAQQVLHIALVAGEEVIQSHQLVHQGQQTFNRVRPLKAGSTGDENAFAFGVTSHVFVTF